MVKNKDKKVFFSKWLGLTPGPSPLLATKKSTSFAASLSIARARFIRGRVKPISHMNLHTNGTANHKETGPRGGKEGKQQLQHKGPKPG